MITAILSDRNIYYDEIEQVWRYTDTKDVVNAEHVYTQPHFKFDLGITAISEITGFQGVVTSRSEHLNGCNLYWVQPRVDKDMKLPDGCWFDENELQPVENYPQMTKGNDDRGGFPSKIK